MKALDPIAAVALCLIALPYARADETAARQIAARTELHDIHTLTLDGSAISHQRHVGQPTPIIEMWARELNAIGISTFALDGFTGRGLTEVSTDQALLGRLNFILDIYRALDVLAQHPRVDPERIAVMGFSRGGQAALYASLVRFHKLWSGVELVAYVPFYPDCMTTYISDTETVARPIRIFAARRRLQFNCRVQEQRRKAAQRRPRRPADRVPERPARLRQSARARSPRPCREVADRAQLPHPGAADGLLINVATKEPFTYKDACVERGPHLGHDPAAPEAAQASVKAFLRLAFKPY